MSQPPDLLTIAFNMISGEIANRQSKLNELHELTVRLQGEIAGLREGQHRIERARPKEASDVGSR